MSSFDQDVDFKELVPQLREHWSTDDIDQWIGLEGDYDHLVGYGRIFWPKFVEYDDCVFREKRFTLENYLGFMKQTNGDKTAVEAVMNHEHITDIFYNATPKPTREMVLYVGRLLMNVWRAKLDHDFPSRKITVHFPEDFSEDLLNYEITFYQER